MNSDDFVISGWIGLNFDRRTGGCFSEGCILLAVVVLRFHVAGLGLPVYILQFSGVGYCWPSHFVLLCCSFSIAVLAAMFCFCVGCCWPCCFGLLFDLFHLLWGLNVCVATILPAIVMALFRSYQWDFIGLLLAVWVSPGHQL